MSRVGAFINNCGGEAVAVAAQVVGLEVPKRSCCGLARKSSGEMQHQKRFRLGATGGRTRRSGWEGVSTLRITGTLCWRYVACGCFVGEACLFGVNLWHAWCGCLTQADCYHEAMSLLGAQRDLRGEHVGDQGATLRSTAAELRHMLGLTFTEHEASAGKEEDDMLGPDGIGSLSDARDLPTPGEAVTATPSRMLHRTNSRMSVSSTGSGGSTGSWMSAATVFSGTTRSTGTQRSFGTETRFGAVAVDSPFFWFAVMRTCVLGGHVDAGELAVAEYLDRFPGRPVSMSEAVMLSRVGAREVGVKMQDVASRVLCLLVKPWAWRYRLARTIKRRQAAVRDVQLVVDHIAQASLQTMTWMCGMWCG